ncbi:MAG: 2-aminoethylphosphonate aminotransferase [Steroidobacteraceae bacterium]
MLLLNPGPVSLSERVRRSLAQPDLCHRESEFFDLQDEARARLLAVYDLDATHWSAVLMTASGTGAVESMLASLVPRTGRVLVVDNGVYGERIAQICAQYQVAHERLSGDWLAAPDLTAMRARLQGAPPEARFSHMAVVHHETTTGRLNDLQPLSRLCAEQGVQLLVDGVSSFGAERIDFSDPALAAVAGTANKCLHGVPGIAFVIVRTASLADAHSRTYYLDLARLARAQQQRNTPFTPAVQACYALVEALREHQEQGGRPARHRRYAQLAEQVRAGLAGLGVQPLIAPEQSSVVLRAYRLPAKLGYQPLHDALKQDGFVIYAGQGKLAPGLFRISTMGELTTADMERLLAGVGRLLR